MRIFGKLSHRERERLALQQEAQDTLKQVLKDLDLASAQRQQEAKQVLKDLAPAADDAAKYDIFATIKTLKEWEDGKCEETDVQRSSDVKLIKLLCVSYNIVPQGAFNATTKLQKQLYRHLRESLEAVSTGLVSVFDLKATTASADFNLELLKCVVKSISADSVDMHNANNAKKTWYTLKYIMLWGRDDLIREHLSEVLDEEALSLIGFASDCP